MIGFGIKFRFFERGSINLPSRKVNGFRVDFVHFYKRNKLRVKKG